jgi:hypothetical protein
MNAVQAKYVLLECKEAQEVISKLRNELSTEDSIILNSIIENFDFFFYRLADIWNNCIRYMSRGSSKHLPPTPELTAVEILPHVYKELIKQEKGVSQ